MLWQRQYIEWAFRDICWMNKWILCRPNSSRLYNSILNAEFQKKWPNVRIFECHYLYFREVLVHRTFFPKMIINIDLAINSRYICRYINFQKNHKISVNYTVWKYSRIKLPQLIWYWTLLSLGSICCSSLAITEE